MPFPQKVEAGLGSAGQALNSCVGERAAPDPLFFPGPLISCGASFRCHWDSIQSSSTSPPLIPACLKALAHTKGNRVRIPFTSSESLGLPW